MTILTPKTYIIRTADLEYYCGKTNNIARRITEHKKEKYPHWFFYRNRRDFNVIYIIDGDYEKKIKSFGVEKFIHCMKGLVS